MTLYFPLEDASNGTKAQNGKSARLAAGCGARYITPPELATVPKTRKWKQKHPDCVGHGLDLSQSAFSIFESCDMDLAWNAFSRSTQVMDFPGLPVV